VVVGVLALQGDVREHLRALEAAGADAVPARTAADLDAVDGLVLPGGESTTIGKLLDIFGLLDPLRARIKDGMPAYGSCAGMILLADEVLGGTTDLPTGQPTVGGLDVTVRRNAFGRQVDSFETDLDVAGVDGGPLHAVFIRAPWVERAGAGVEVLATVHDHPVAVRQGALLATSFHPELTSDTRLHEFFVSLVSATRHGGRGR
jgi:5'-phosphate synthase pdxT subunit